MATRANQLGGAEWLKNSFSIWRGLGKDRDSREHPASFPVALVERLIDCYCADPQGVVLDPFAGSGSTLIAALRKGMTAVGMDINPEYVEMFKRRLGNSASHNYKNKVKYEVGDSRNMNGLVTEGSVEICVTSPPYWDILNRKRSADGKMARPYSANGDDLGNMEGYDEYLTALGAVACQVDAKLRVGGYFVLNVMDIRKGGTLYPLHINAVESVESQTGLILDDIIIWDRQSDYNSMRPLGYPYKFIINKVHEYMLVFRKRMMENGSNK